MRYYTSMKNHIVKEHLIAMENKIYYVGEKAVKKLVVAIKSHFNKMHIYMYAHTHTCICTYVSE